MARARNRAWDAVVLAPEDDVAMALADLPPGTVRIRLGEAVETVTLAEPIPLGHKFARRAIAAGALVRKYGAPIGEAKVAIAAGAHVHVHNVRSRRARRHEEETHAG
jgi:hypothetical protein